MEPLWRPLWQPLASQQLLHAFQKGKPYLILLAFHEAFVFFRRQRALQRLFRLLVHDLIDAVIKTEIRIHHTPPVMSSSGSNHDLQSLIPSLWKRIFPIRFLREIRDFQGRFHIICIALARNGFLRCLRNLREIISDDFPAFIYIGNT